MYLHKDDRELLHDIVLREELHYQKHIKCRCNR